jgi:catechol 2,3-dioxygenase-like lactoylglutathione lyase family enzyme
VSALQGLVEVVLVVGDIERSLAFYRDTLGLELISPPELAAKFLRIGPPVDDIPCQIVLVPRTAQHGEPAGRALHHIGLEVDAADYQAEHDRLRALGLELRYGQHPFLPVDAFYVDDPDGNEIEIAAWRGSS